MNGKLISISAWLAIILLVACAPSPQAIQTAIAETQVAIDQTHAAIPTVVPTKTPVPTPTFTPTIAPGATQASSHDGMVLVYVPAGEFTMGSDNEDYGDHKPAHIVYLDAFWIDRTEVTNSMFETFVNQSGYKTDAEEYGHSRAFNPDIHRWSYFIRGADWRHPQGPNSSLLNLSEHPVVNVSWKDAQSYCEWAGRRLPTEAEWEKAARGTDARIYPWGDQPLAGNLLNFRDVNLNMDLADRSVNDGYQFTAPVGSYPSGASPYGVLDMSGNVAEWVKDWFSPTYYSESPKSNPTGPVSGKAYVTRGGSWGSIELLVRSYYRDWFSMELDHSTDTLGFRCSSLLP